jgi:hypothetical protein
MPNPAHMKYTTLLVAVCWIALQPTAPVYFIVKMIINAVIASGTASLIKRMIAEMTIASIRHPCTERPAGGETKRLPTTIRMESAMNKTLKPKFCFMPVFIQSVSFIVTEINVNSR